MLKNLSRPFGSFFAARGFRTFLFLLAVTTSGAALPVFADDNFNSPPISGELFDFSRPDLAHLVGTSAQVTTAPGGKPALQVTFAHDTAYPNLAFPVPAGGWNLAAFGGVQIELTNTGTTPVMAGLRIDNPGREPFNVQVIPIAPGQSKTLKVVFRKSNGPSQAPFNSEKVVGIQLLAYRPTASSTLVFSGLRAVGSPVMTGGKYSTPSDRKTTVTPPDWIGQRPPVPGDWVQTFNEDFKNPALNEKVWGTRLSWTGTLPTWTHRFSQDNLIFKDGLLKIKCEKRTGHAYDDPKLLSRKYTTAMITTFDKWTQCYGYFEARMKLPTARGLWAAFWMMPDRAPGATGDRETTKDGGMEFDILEHLTEWGPGRYNTAVHWDGYGKDHKSWGNNQNYYGRTADGWHTWGMLWEPGKVTWYCDGVKKADFANTHVGSVPDDFILDVQMGGWATKNVDDAHLPDYLQIDYVRAWQLKERLAP